MTRIIMLDIDGVLNSRQWQQARGSAPDGLTPQARAMALADRAFDPAAVRCLGELLKRTGASVVLSSTWRLDGGASYVERLLGLHGLRVRFVGVTPDGSRMRASARVTRGTEIARWLQLGFVPAQSLAILDDEPSEEFGTLAPWHVATDFMRSGLLPEHVEIAVSLLGRDDRPAIIDAVSAQIESAGLTHEGDRRG